MDTPIDSLTFAYDVRTMTILVGDTPVHYSVVFDPETGLKRAEFIQVRGSLSPYESIQMFGEKYRKGLLIYKERREGDDK